MNSLGSKIRKARKEKGLTQLQLADNHISRSLLSMIENGTANPSMITLQYIADKLEKPLAYFLVESFEVTEKCESLITSMEQALQSQQYETVISEIKAFNEELLCGNFSYLTSRQSGILHFLLAYALYYSSQPGAHDYLLAAEALLLKTDSILYLSRVYNQLSILMYKQSKYPEMEQYLIKANSLITVVTVDNARLKYDITYHLALCYYRQRKFEEVIRIIEDLLVYCRKYELYYSFGSFNMLLALAYKDTNNLSAAIECNFRAVSYYNFVTDKWMLHRCYVNISILYRLSKDSYNAMSYINNSIRYFEETDDIKHLINARIEKLISMFVFNIDRNSIAGMAKILIHHENIEAIPKGELLCLLGCLELKEQNYEKALTLLKEAESLIQDYINSEVNIYLYKGLCEIYSQMGTEEEAARYQQKSEAIFLQKPYFRDFFAN